MPIEKGNIGPDNFYDQREARAVTTLCFEQLRSHIGQTITIKRGPFSFCTEEGHPPHYSPPNNSDIEEIKLRLDDVNPEPFQLIGVSEDGQELVIPFSAESTSSSYGSYSINYIMQINLSNRPLFETKISQDPKPGFQGQFYFRLEELPQDDRIRA